MTSDKFRHATKQETLEAAPTMRTNDNQIGAPLCCGIDDRLSDVAYLDGSVYFEPGATQLRCNSLYQFMGRFLLIFQLRSVA